MFEQPLKRFEMAGHRVLNKLPPDKMRFLESALPEGLSLFRLVEGTVGTYRSINGHVQISMSEGFTTVLGPWFDSKLIVLPQEAKALVEREDDISEDASPLIIELPNVLTKDISPELDIHGFIDEVHNFEEGMELQVIEGQSRRLLCISFKRETRGTPGPDGAEGEIETTYEHNVEPCPFDLSYLQGMNQKQAMIAYLAYKAFGRPISYGAVNDLREDPSKWMVIKDVPRNILTDQNIDTMLEGSAKLETLKHWAREMRHLAFCVNRGTSFNVDPFQVIVLDSPPVWAKVVDFLDEASYTAHNLGYKVAKFFGVSLKDVGETLACGPMQIFEKPKGWLGYPKNFVRNFIGQSVILGLHGASAVLATPKLMTMGPAVMGSRFKMTWNSFAERARKNWGLFTSNFKWESAPQSWKELGHNLWQTVKGTYHVPINVGVLALARMAWMR